jgi:hypothetical protein
MHQSYSRFWQVHALITLFVVVLFLAYFQTVFMISPDHVFSQTGARSGINWEVFFNRLRFDYHDLHTCSPDEFSKVLELCESIVFGGSGDEAYTDDESNQSSRSGIDFDEILSTPAPFLHPSPPPQLSSEVHLGGSQVPPHVSSSPLPSSPDEPSSSEEDIPLAVQYKPKTKLDHATSSKGSSPSKAKAAAAADMPQSKSSMKKSKAKVTPVDMPQSKSKGKARAAAADMSKSKPRARVQKNLRFATDDV